MPESPSEQFIINIKRKRLSWLGIEADIRLDAGNQMIRPEDSLDHRIRAIRRDSPSGPLFCQSKAVRTALQALSCLMNIAREH